MRVHGPYDRSGAQGCASYVFCGAYANVCLKVLGCLPCIFKCINVCLTCNSVGTRFWYRVFAVLQMQCGT